MFSCRQGIHTFTKREIRHTKQNKVQKERTSNHMVGQKDNTSFNDRQENETERLRQTVCFADQQLDYRLSS